MENYHSEPVITLALDIATRTGWAMKTPERLSSGMVDFKLKVGDGYGMRYLRFDRWLQKMYDGMQLSPGVYPTIRIVYEKPIGYSDRDTAVPAGMAGVMLKWCERNGITLYEAISPQTIKTRATGDYRARKDVVAAAAAEKWPDQFPPKKFPDDNQADALWLLDWALNN